MVQILISYVTHHVYGLGSSPMSPSVMLLNLFNLLHYLWHLYLRGLRFITTIKRESSDLCIRQSLCERMHKCIPFMRGRIMKLSIILRKNTQKL